MHGVMSRFGKSWEAVGLLAACGIAMLAAAAVVYLSASPSVSMWEAPDNSREIASRMPLEPEAFKFREGIAPLQAAEINAAVPESDEPILPAKIRLRSCLRRPLGAAQLVGGRLPDGSDLL